MPYTTTEIRPGAYYDSVILMQLQRSLADLDGVIDAGVVMATPANCALLEEGDLYPEEARAAKSDDLLIVVHAESEDAAASALDQVDELIAARRSKGGSAGYRPHTLDAALEQRPEARWLLISVPGRYAAGVAHEGLDRGLNIFLYSDNVSIEDELALKKKARSKGLMVMGPDCGTAIVNGVGLGFANRVRRGAIGLVGASGTGLQAVTSEIHRLGGGVSQALGTGGRDLKAEIGGITALQGLEALAEDPESKVIVLVSKPPDPEVAARLLSAARRIGKPVVVNFIGYAPPSRRLANLHFAVNLAEAAEIAVALAGTGEATAIGTVTGMDGDLADAAVNETDGKSTNPSDTGSLIIPSETDSMAPKQYLRGLFSGGTLAVEAVLGLQNLLHPLHSNVPIRKDQALPDPHKSLGHTIVDLGEDEFTQGRLHPMMDNDLRIRRIRQEADDPETGVILLDVVLGEGAHADPAAELAPVVAEVIQDHGLPVLVVLVGTDEDPQGEASQAVEFKNAGAEVFETLQPAIHRLADLFPAPSERRSQPIPAEVLTEPFTAINAGLESFSESLAGQGAAVVQLDWRPPAGGNEKLAGILAKLASK